MLLAPLVRRSTPRYWLVWLVWVHAKVQVAAEGSQRRLHAQANGPGGYIAQSTLSVGALGIAVHPPAGVGLGFWGAHPWHPSISNLP